MFTVFINMLVISTLFSVQVCLKDWWIKWTSVYRLWYSFDSQDTIKQVNKFKNHIDM